MTSRLFHAVILCGAALGAFPIACGTASDDDEGRENDDKGVDDRCKLDDGTCDEHCTPLPDGGCLDPCFVHTETCSPDCVQQDGSCGWPPTK